MTFQIIIMFILWTKVSLLNAEDLLNEIPASTLQMARLAQYVCIDLFEDETYSKPVSPKIQEKRTACENSFLSHTHIPENPPKLTIKERTSDLVSFAVTPSEHTQIVALVNEFTPNEIIYYSLLNNNEISDVLYPDRKENYTFWTAALSSNGITSLWRRGPILLSWQQLHEQSLLIDEEMKKQYNIQNSFLMDSYKNGTYYISGQFWWRSSDPADLYFEVVNNCNDEVQGNLYHRTIGPLTNLTVILQKLPLNDTCTIRVKGKYAMTNYTYQTPACENVPQCEPPPEIPLNLSVDVSQEIKTNLWLVQVRWARPRRQPTFYNVTVRAITVQSKVVPGNVTEVKFRNVKGEGLYNVSVVARKPGKKPAVANLRDFFPVRETSTRSNGLMMGASWAAALITLSALLMFVLYVRRRMSPKCPAKIYFPGVLEKLSEEGDTDVGSPESGAEDQWEVRPERLLIHEVIGEGAFGVVRRGTLAPANKNVAVKMLKDFPSLEEIRSFRAEMELMKSVGAHPHVVSLLGCCSGRRLLIVAEYCSRGDLLSYLRCSWDLMLSRRHAKYYNNNKEDSNYRNDLFKNKPESRSVTNRLYELQGVCDTELTLLDLLSFCRQIAMGMEFLASNRVVHRDLAARNILVTADRTLKIADFGLSRDVYQENQYKQKSNGKMPVKWMALESLTHRIYTTHTDVWSFGVVMWEVVTLGGAPYAGVSAARLPRLLAAGYRMPRPHNCSVQLYQLMLSCWNDRPRSRPSFAELHATLDDLLCASADHYISLSQPAMAPDDVAPNAPLSRYVRNLMRTKWRNGKLYERPLTTTTNHYTAQPAPIKHI